MAQKDANGGQLRCFVECGVCLNTFTSVSGSHTPRVLHCGHTYCSPCLKRLLSGHSAGRQCPECRKAVIGRTISDFPVNRMVTSLCSSICANCDQFGITKSCTQNKCKGSYCRMCMVEHKDSHRMEAILLCEDRENELKRREKEMADAITTLVTRFENIVSKYRSTNTKRLKEMPTVQSEEDEPMPQLLQKTDFESIDEVTNFVKEVTRLSKRKDISSSTMSLTSRHSRSARSTDELLALQLANDHSGRTIRFQWMLDRNEDFA